MSLGASCCWRGRFWCASTPGLISPTRGSNQPGALTPSCICGRRNFHGIMRAEFPSECAGTSDTAALMNRRPRAGSSRST